MAEAIPVCQTQQKDLCSSSLAMCSRAPTSAGSPPRDLDTLPVPLSMSRSNSDAVDSAVAVLAEASRTSTNSSLAGCCQGSVCRPSAAAGAQTIASGNAAEMAAMLSAHRQMATGAAESACEIQHNLRACSGVLGNAAKSAFEASAKAGPTGGLAWQIAVLDAMPLGPTALDYSFTARGQLPEGVQQSQLAAAFGPENAESEGEDTPGKAARVQIGNALVALLESHRKHRYTVASADPEQIITKLCSLPKQATDSVEVDKKERSLTRSLTRSAASSPLVQLLATHRKRREDLTGWQDEASCSSDDELPQPRLSGALSGQAAQVLQAENALSLKPLLMPVERRSSGQLPPLPPSLGRLASEPEVPPELPSGSCPPCPGSPTEPPLPPSTRSSVDGRSSLSSYRSVQADSVFSRASSDGQSTDWATALSGTTACTSYSRSSLDGYSSRRGSTDGRPSFEGRPPLSGLALKRADTADSSILSTAPDPIQTGVLEGQCPGCGSLSECCCKDMELGSHPDLESIPDDVASISDFVGSALKGASAPLPSSLKEPSASSADSDKALRRLLLKQMPCVEEGGEPGGPSQRLASRGASFSEVLESCMRSNSSAASRRGRRQPVDVFAEPFIPVTSQSLSGSSGSNDGEDKMDGQPLGGARAWSFDDTLQRQRYLNMRPGLLNRHSLDAGDKDKTDKSSYVALMAEYRTRMGMDRSSRSSSLALMAENPSASADVSGALRQAFRNQLQTPACSPPCFESPLLNGEYNALRPDSDPSASGSTPADDRWGRGVAGARSRAQGLQQGSAQQQPQPACATGVPLKNWPSDGMEDAGSGDVNTVPPGISTGTTKGSVNQAGALAPSRAAMAARSSLLFKPATMEPKQPLAKVQDKPGNWKPPASPRSSVDGMSVSRADTTVNSRAALSPGPSGATAAIALGIAHGTGRHDEPAPFARQSCARVRASLELRRRSADASAAAQPLQEHPPISFPQLPAAPSPAQLPMSFIKSPSRLQRSSSEEQAGSQGKDTGSVLAAVAAQLGQSAAPSGAPLELTAAGRAPSARRSAQLQRQLPTVVEGVAIGVACNARELSLKLGVPDLRTQPSSDTSPADASHEPPDLEPAEAAAEAPAAGNKAAGRLAAAQQLFFQGAKPARRRMSTTAGMLAAENAGSPLQFPQASPRLRPLQLSSPTASSDRATLLQRIPRPSSPGTPPAVCEATPFSELPHPERIPSPAPTSFIMQGLSEGVLHSAPAMHRLGHPGLPLPSSHCAVSSPMLFGFHGTSNSSGSPSRSTTGSHELEDTYGAYRLRADAPGALSGAPGARHTVGSVAPSSFWLEHRAAAHHTASGSMRGHVSMDETRLQSSSWLNTPVDFSRAGSGPPELLSEDAECLLTARRDNYVARTFSHMARARLDHAVSRSADLELLESEKWEMRFADDGPCTLSQSGASEEGAISKAKRMMSEAATAQACVFLRGEGTDQRDVDGTSCLLDALAVPKVTGKKQQDVLSTLAFLTTGSELNAGSVVASRGMATLVPLLLKRSEKIVIGAAVVIANVLISPAGQDAFAEENGLTVLSSLLSTSKSSSLLQAVLRCLGAYVQHACVPGIGAGPLGSTGQPAQPGAHGRAAGNVMLLERSRGVSAAVRLSSAYGHPEYTPAEAKAVSLAALDLLLKVSAIPEMRTTLRTAGLMSALAAIVTPGSADTAALLEPAIQLVAALASDLAAAVEFTAGGGVLGLLAILSDSSAKGSLSMHAATVLGVLVNCRRVRGAIWAAGGGSVLLPTVATASPQTLRGLLYLLSCLARFEDMRGELEGAGAVDVLLELLGSCQNTKVQAATLSLLRILTKAGKTLRAIPEHQSCVFRKPSFVPERPSLGNAATNKRRSLDGPINPDVLPATQALAAFGRSHSMCL